MNNIQQKPIAQAQNSAFSLMFIFQVADVAAGALTILATARANTEIRKAVDTLPIPGTAKKAVTVAGTVLVAGVTYVAAQAGGAYLIEGYVHQQPFGQPPRQERAWDNNTDHRRKY